MVYAPIALSHEEKSSIQLARKHELIAAGMEEVIGACLNHSPRGPPIIDWARPGIEVEPPEMKHITGMKQKAFQKRLAQMESCVDCKTDPFHAFSFGKSILSKVGEDIGAHKKGVGSGTQSVGNWQSVLKLGTTKAL